MWMQLAASMILGGLKAKAKDKTDRRQTREALQEEGYQSRLSAAYDMQLEDWMRRRMKDERRGGLSNYAQFSTLEGYNPVWTPSPAGNMPLPPGSEAKPGDLAPTPALSIEEQMRRRQQGVPPYGG